MNTLIRTDKPQGERLFWQMNKTELRQYIDGHHAAQQFDADFDIACRVFNERFADITRERVEAIALEHLLDIPGVSQRDAEDAADRIARRVETIAKTVRA